MIYSLIRNKLVIVAVSVLVVIFIGAGIYLNIKNAPPAIKSVIKSQNTANIITVDYKEYEDKFSKSQQDSINKALTDYIHVTQTKETSNYSASSRKGSYSQILFEEKIPLTTLLIDVPNIHRTYEMSLDGGPDYDHEIMYIRCAPKDLQIDKSVECKDVQI